MAKNWWHFPGWQRALISSSANIYFVPSIINHRSVQWTQHCFHISIKEACVATILFLLHSMDIILFQCDYPNLKILSSIQRYRYFKVEIGFRLIVFPLCDQCASIKDVQLYHNYRSSSTMGNKWSYGAFLGNCFNFWDKCEWKDSVFQSYSFSIERNKR